MIDRFLVPDYPPVQIFSEIKRKSGNAQSGFFCTNILSRKSEKQNSMAFVPNFLLKVKALEKNSQSYQWYMRSVLIFFNTHNIFKDSIAQAKAAAQNADRELPALPET